MSKHTDILRFRGELPERFAGAMLELGPLLGFAAGEGGTVVEVFRAAGPVVEKGPEGIRLGWRGEAHPPLPGAVPPAGELGEGYISGLRAALL